MKTKNKKEQTLLPCQHQIVLCKLHNCERCGKVGEETRCRQAHVKSLNEAYPTFEQMISIYLKATKGCRRHVSCVIQSVLSDIRRVGLSGSSRSLEMTRSRFKDLVRILSSPNEHGATLRRATILSHLAAFRSITSDCLADEYEDRGLEIPTFSIPKLNPEFLKVQEVSDRTIRKVEIEMEKWLASGTKSNVDAYKYMFFALYCGMRAGDICNSKWEIVKHTNCGIMIVYVPHKTLHIRDTPVTVSIDNKTFCKIEPLIGKQDEFIISRHPECAPEAVTKHGEYIGTHVYLRNKVNRMLSECGIGNEYRGQKKTHAIRKYFVTERVLQFGRQQAADEAGHSMREQRRSYLGTLHGKVA